MAETNTPRTRPNIDFQPFVAWLEYAGLWAIAIAYPLFNGIVSAPEALAIEGAGRLDVILLIVILTLIPPSVLTSLEAGITALRQPAGMWFRAGILGTLVGLILWQALLDREAGSLLRMGLPLVLGGLFAFARMRLTFVRNFTELLAIALPVVILQFCLMNPVRVELLPQGSAGDTPSIESGTPVVMIILDEFSLPLVERSRGEIDDRLFPGFGQLANESTWYSNALATTEFSTVAVPAILTGDKPGYHDPIKPPSSARYPDNLCNELKSGGYEINAYEPFTNLCGQGYSLGTRLSEMVELGTTIQITPGALVNRTATQLKEWSGDGYLENMANRGDRADSFIDDLPGGRNRFDLLHITLPHFPWVYMPDGEEYRFVPSEYYLWQGPQDKVNADMQRGLAQIQFVDNRLTDWIAQLKQKGIWDEALVVVTADHGINFATGEYGRILSTDNAGAILPVPLFIKYPNQSKGFTDPRPASSIDVAPTIRAVIGADPPAEHDGRSLLLDPIPQQSDTFTLTSQLGPVDLSLRKVERQRQSVIAHRNNLFGSGTIFAVGGHNDLLGRPAASVERLRPLSATFTLPDLWGDVDLDAPLQPVLVEATIPSGQANDELPYSGTPPIAVAVNGQIATTNRAWDLDADTKTLRVIIPAESLKDGTNRIALFAIESD
ncbi:MAG: sulfatase-like hydrolase/transferase [Solirubrobacterales bacterium]